MTAPASNTLFGMFILAVAMMLHSGTAVAQWVGSESGPLLVAPNSGEVLAPEEEAEINEILRVAADESSFSRSLSRIPVAIPDRAHPTPATRLPIQAKTMLPMTLEEEVMPNTNPKSGNSIKTKKLAEPIEAEEQLFDVPGGGWTPAEPSRRSTVAEQIVADDFSGGFLPVEGGVYDEQTLAMLQQMNAGYVPNTGFVTGMPGGGLAGRLLQNLTIHMGGQGFTNELDLGRNANFGFSEGFNWAGPITPLSTISGQFGFRSTQSDFTGSWQSKNHRTQYMFTAGLFRRSPCHPIQMGVVYDWFQDNYAGKYKLEQIRAEISYRTYGQYEFGFLGGFGTKTDGNEWIHRHFAEVPNDTRAQVAASSYYMLFIRKNLLNGGIGRLEVGMSEWGDTLFGGKYELPINDKLELNAGFTMVIPKEGHGRGGYQKETWNIGFEFVYHFHGGVLCKQQNPYRPMFDVADNGSLFPRISR